MNAELRRRVRERAGARCEYCRLKQEHEVEHSFHIEHIIALSHGGGDSLENLALACQLCNLLKGPNLTSLDPDTGQLSRLFHPRTDAWDEHFKMDGARISGMTPIGRTTVWLFEMNHEDRVDLRTVLIKLGEWP